MNTHTRTPLIWIVPGLTQSGARSDHPVDLMSIYPTLCEVAGVAVPKHVDGLSLRPLLKDPDAAWSVPALTTHGAGNHAVRATGWRYIQYDDGSEELYDAFKDPNEWTNLAGKPEYDDRIRMLRAFVPLRSVPSIGGGRADGAGEAERPPASDPWKAILRVDDQHYGG